MISRDTFDGLDSPNSIIAFSRSVSEKEGRSGVSFDEIADVSDIDDDDELFQTEADSWQKYARSSKPLGVHQTFVRMDEICKQVQRISNPSLRQLQDFRKSLRERGIEQEEMMMKQNQHRRESFGAKLEESKDGDSAWEAAEEDFVDDVSRSTMEEQFVKSVQTDHALDLHLLKLLGPEVESKLFMNYQCIDEYFRHKNTIMERKIGQKSMSMAMQSGDESLKELSSWHGATGQMGRRQTLRGTTPGGKDEPELDSDDDVEEPKPQKASSRGSIKAPERFSSNSSQKGSLRRISSSGSSKNVLPVAPGANMERRPTIAGMLRARQGADKFKQLQAVAAKRGSSQPEVGRERSGTADEVGSHRSGASTPTSEHAGGEQSPHGPRMKTYMQKKGMGRLYKRSATRNTKDLEVPNDASHAGGDELPRQKLGSMINMSMKLKAKAAQARSSIEERGASNEAPKQQQTVLPEISTPRGQTLQTPRGSAAPGKPQTPRTPAKPGARSPMSSRPRPKTMDQL